MNIQAHKTLARAADGRYHLHLTFPPLWRRFADLNLTMNAQAGYGYDRSVVFHALACSEYHLAYPWEIPEEVALGVIKAWYGFERQHYGTPMHAVAESITDERAEVRYAIEQPSIIDIAC